MPEIFWLVVLYLPLWKIWKSVGMIIPKGHIKHVPNHQQVFACFGLVVSLLGLRIEFLWRIVWLHWIFAVGAMFTLPNVPVEQDNRLAWNHQKTIEVALAGWIVSIQFNTKHGVVHSDQDIMTYQDTRTGLFDFLSWAGDDELDPMRDS